eukprot:7867618-Pyramimonas_sp.AAC.1
MREALAKLEKVVTACEAAAPAQQLGDVADWCTEPDNSSSRPRKRSPRRQSSQVCVPGWRTPTSRIST